MVNNLFVANLAQDVRYGLRMFAKSPGFAAVAVLTLALGVGANTAIFSVIDGVLLRPLPYNQPAQLVRVFGVWPTQPKFPNSPADFLDYRERNHVFSSFAAYVRHDLDLTVQAQPVRLKGMRVSADYFRTLGVAPSLGRDFLQAEETRGNDQVVILSNELWRDVFHSDPNINGKSLTLSGLTYTIIGVMPPGVQHVGGDYRSLPYGETVSVWTPFPLLPLGEFARNQHFLNGVARLRAGVTIGQANAEMNILATQLEQEHPDSNSNGRIKLVPLKEEIVGSARSMLLVLFGAAAFVLLIACVNVANLTLTRALARQRELAVRAVLGAGRVRLVQQLFTESLMFALAGGAGGLVLAFWGVATLPRLAPEGMPRLQAVHVNLRAFAFALFCSVLTALLFGLAPALSTLRGRGNDALKEAAYATTGKGRARLRSLVVIGEVSLALILLIGAGLLLRTFLRLRTQDPGFRPEHVLTVSIDLPSSRYADAAGNHRFYQQLTERVGTLPGVTAVGAASDIPWTGYDENSGFQISGHPTAPEDEPEARYHFVTPGYFQAIGTPLLAGRFFSAADTPDSPPVVLVNAALARRYFPGETAVGKRLDLWGTENMQIVGVVGDVKDTPMDHEAKPAFYWNDWQVPARDRRFLAVRSNGDPALLAASVRSEVLGLDKDLPVSDVRTLDDVSGAANSAARFTLLLVSLFGGLALLLAAVGIYGVMSYAVGQRTKEFGIRIAFGARGADVLRLVMTGGLYLALSGIGLGLLGALALTRLIATLLFGVTPTDTLTFAAVSLGLLLVALVACYLPARRAMKVNPLVALRYE
jgi:putative ABC transport system permease protein